MTATISLLSATDIEPNIVELGRLMHACVVGGASVGYIVPYTEEDARAFWLEKVLEPVRAGGRALWVARAGGSIAGSVQLDTDTPPNQPHRGEVRKLLVHPDHRRQGVARALMAELEAHAPRIGRSLLTLDTRTGDAAEPLYKSMGYKTAGILPGWCRDTLTERLDATTFMYKTL
jgi:ribosomal protein S18 acetylase RimI-like enzyme